MFPPDQYRLIDFGAGEKLEQFADRTIRRQTPSVDGFSANKQPWQPAVRYSKGQPGTWSQPAPPGDWTIEHQGKKFVLRQTPSGQVGVFPEQAQNWQWIARHQHALNGLSAINLFGYTGGSTMALAKCGATVTHVDSAKSVVSWAKSNVALSNLEEATIRWIVDGAVEFVEREIKRGKQYQIVVADPPSFGRGLKKSVWKIQRDLPRLFELIHRVTGNQLKMLLVSCHTPGIDARALRQMAWSHLPLLRARGDAIGLDLKSDTGKTLTSGDCFRWSSDDLREL